MVLFDPFQCSMKVGVELMLGDGEDVVPIVTTGLLDIVRTDVLKSPSV